MTLTAIFRNPADPTDRTRPITTITEFTHLADQLTAVFHTTGRTSAPGITLHRGDPDTATESIAIGVTPTGWALIHTDTDTLTQHRTHNTNTTDGHTVTVDWGQPDDVPTTWFIPVPDATAALDQWITTHHLDTTVLSSTDCS